uniref:Ribose-5-phosphate isomerase n=3 Tax=Rhipicephalus TaxID=34630 RepID=A0A6M2CL96_RHIMP
MVVLFSDKFHLRGLRSFAFCLANARFACPYVTDSRIAYNVPTQPTRSSVVKMDLVEKAKEAAAQRAVDNHIKNNYIVGIGSGSTVVYAVEHLARRVKEHGWKISCVPTSFQAKELIRKHGLVMTDLEESPELNVAIDGADEIDAKLTLIKGGGGCLTQEKIIASCAKEFVVVADYRKDSSTLGENWKKGIPVEVIPMSYVPVQRKIEKLLGHKAELRQAAKKCGPVVTDNGNFILDCKFTPQKDWSAVNTALKMIPGVVETGLFVGMAHKAYYGLNDGSVNEKKAP